MTANIIIDILVLILGSIGILTSFLIFFLIFRYRRQCSFTTATLLICNNYVAVIFCCAILVDMYSHNLYGYLHINVSFDNWYCYIRAYIISVTLTLIYHSYLLQACFRLSRIVFYKRRKLQSFSLIILFIFIQWSAAFLILLPALYLHEFDYITPDYYYCQALYTNIRALMHTSVVVYYFPMGAIGSIYFYILYYMKKRSSLPIQMRRQLANQRDLIVLKRIIILIGMLFIVTFPAMLIYLCYVITGYLYSMIYQFQWLTFSFGLSILPMGTAILTPQLRELLNRQFRPNHRIHPILPTQ